MGEEVYLIFETKGEFDVEEFKKFCREFYDKTNEDNKYNEIFEKDFKDFDKERDKDIYESKSIHIPFKNTYFRFYLNTYDKIAKFGDLKPFIKKYKRNLIQIIFPSFIKEVHPKFFDDSIDLIKTIFKNTGWRATASVNYDWEEGNETLTPNYFDCDYLWSVNLFPPSEVKKYGRKKLLNAPCELIEEWEDGAIFMMIHKNRFSSTYEERKKLREYLGVK